MRGILVNPLNTQTPNVCQSKRGPHLVFEVVRGLICKFEGARLRIACGYTGQLQAEWYLYPRLPYISINFPCRYTRFIEPVYLRQNINFLENSLKCRPKVVFAFLGSRKRNHRLQHFALSVLYSQSPVSMTTDRQKHPNK